MGVRHWDLAQRVSNMGGAGLLSLLSNAINADLGKGGFDSMEEEGNSAMEFLWNANVPMSH